MKCSKCNTTEMKNCFQAGHTDPICEKCFFNGGQDIKIKIFYETKNILMDDIDKIHADMIGIVGGDMLDVNVKDIAFNDDNTAIIIGSIKASQLEGRSMDFVMEYSCNTIEEADKNLHNFITKFIEFKIID